MNQSYMPKSKSDVHITPDRVWDMIYQRWNYSQGRFFDPCPLNEDFDGLEIEWEELNYVNPPYTLLKEFVHKAFIENNKGKEVILLLPSKTDQNWFHVLLMYKPQILWIEKRLKFKNNKWYSMQPHFLARLK